MGVRRAVRGSAWAPMSERREQSTMKAVPAIILALGAYAPLI